MKLLSRYSLALCLLCVGLPVLSEAPLPEPAKKAAKFDWPNWRGPNHDAISRETGLLKSWPKDGPKLLWSVDLTGAYSSVTVANGKVYTMTKKGKKEIVVCLDEETGKPAWDYPYDCDYSKYDLDNRFLTGPRSTPTVHDGKVHALGTTGLFHCLDAKTGKKIWQQDLVKLSGADLPEGAIGYCASPLVVEDLVYVQVGGKKDNSIAALNVKDGTVKWKALSDPIGHATPVLIEFEGKPQVIFFTGAAGVGVEPKTGKVLWRQPWKTSFDLHVATPIHSGGKVFLSSNYNTGGILVKLNGKEKPETVWKNLDMRNWFSTCVLHEGHLYGFSQDRLRCVDFETGKVKWDKVGLGMGSLILADGHLLVLGERGTLVLAEAKPDKYVEKSRWEAFRSRCWSVPILANGKLIVRDEKKIMALKVVK